MKNFLIGFNRKINLDLSKCIQAYTPIMMENALKKIEKKYDRIESPSEQSIDEIYKQFNDLLKNKIKEIPSRNIKNLPFIIYYKIISEGISAYKKLFSLLDKKRSSILNKLVFLYLTNTPTGIEKVESCELERDNLVRTEIYSCLYNYKGTNRKTLGWKKKLYIFTEKGAQELCNKINFEQYQESIIKLGLNKEIIQGNYMQKVLKLYYTNPKVSIVKKINSLKSVFDNFASDEGIYLDVVPITANLIIEGLGVDASENIKEELRSFYIKHLRDPRLPEGEVRWAKVEKKGRDIFTIWLSQYDLEMFFQIVEESAKDKAWKYRRKFWSNYLPYIKKTWVILGPYGIRLIEKIVSGKKYQHGRIISGASSDQSIFLIEMGDFVFAEWSHNGKLRIWKKNNCPIKFGETNYKGEKIREEKDCIEAIVHSAPSSYSWQVKTEKWIEKNCDIRNNKSYEIEGAINGYKRKFMVGK